MVEQHLSLLLRIYIYIYIYIGGRIFPLTSLCHSFPRYISMKIFPRVGVGWREGRVREIQMRYISRR